MRHFDAAVEIAARITAPKLGAAYRGSTNGGLQANLFDKRFWDFTHETRRSAQVNLAVKPARLCMAQIEFVFRAGYADVGKSAFLFESGKIVHRHLVGEQSLFHAH